MPTARASATAAAVDGKLYVIGGLVLGTPGTNVVEVYDPPTDSWHAAPSDPVARSGAGAAEIGGKIYVVGGCIDSDCIPGLTSILEEFDPATGTWTTKSPMPTPRFAAAVGAIDGELYVAGGAGVCGACDVIAAVEVYDPATDTWTSKNPMPTPQGFTGGAVINGKLYVAGGRTSTEDWSATTQVYDPVADQWTTLAPMPSPAFLDGVAATNGLLYVVGGQTSTGAVLDTVFAYDPATNLWTTLPPALTARSSMAAAEINGTIYVEGGRDRPNGIDTMSSANEFFTPASEGPRLVSMVLSPADTTIDVGQTVTYTATGTFSDGSIRPVGPGTGQGIPFTYFANQPGIVVFDGLGAATGVGPGVVTVTAIASLLDGRQVTATATVRFRSADVIPPITIATELPGPNGNGWNNSPVSIALNATDNAGGSGVASVVYSTPNGVVATPGPVANLTITAQGITPVIYYAIDRAGNAELPKTLTVSIDQLPPTQIVPGPIRADATSPSGANVAFTVSSFDTLSGIESNSISWPSGSMFPIGTTAVTYTSTDRAGNTSTSTFTVTVLSPAQMTANLIANTSLFGFQQGTSLLGNVLNKLPQLASVFAPLAGGAPASTSPAQDTGPIAACNQLGAFLHQVAAQTGNQLTIDQAALLAAAAQRIESAAGCSVR